MRAIICGDLFNEEVIGEEFTIDGCDEKFIVHRSIENRNAANWAATHAASGFAIGYGDTPDDAIAHGRKRWLSRTPEQIADALAMAYAVRDARMAERG